MEQAEARANTYETVAKVKFAEREVRESNKKPIIMDHKKYIQVVKKVIDVNI